MPLLESRLCEVAYSTPLLPLLKMYFTPIKGAACALVPLGSPPPPPMCEGGGGGSPCTVGSFFLFAHGNGIFSNQGGGGMDPCAPCATERGAGRRGDSPFHGREIFENSCIKTTFSYTLLLVYVVAKTNSLLFFFLFFLFLLNLSQGNILFLFFPFLLFPFFLFFTRRLSLLIIISL